MAPATPRQSSTSSRVDGYVPLREYAAIGDGRTVALIALDGRIDWLPVPGTPRPPMFAAVLDTEQGGRFELQPAEPFTVTREYVDGTNVLRTRFTCASGVVDVTDVLSTGVAGRLPWMQLVRRIEGVTGAVPMRWIVEPGNVFGTHAIERIDTGNVPLLRAGATNIALTGADVGREDPVHPGRGMATDWGPDFRGAFTTAPGSRHVLCLTGTEDEPVRAPDPRTADESVDRTIADWQKWSKVFSWDGPWPEAVLRSALALKLLVYSPSGAIAAAATTSLPEDLDGGKNWDYRFAWVRDLAYTVDAFLRLGLREEPHGAVSWMLKALEARTKRGMAVFLSLDGGPTDGVHRMDAPGWRGIGPVLKGNQASGQLQLGVYADLIGLMRSYTADGNLLDEASSDLLVRLADEVCERWKQKDSGMWELTTLQHYVSSKMGCWQALDAACALEDMGYLLPPPGARKRWERHKDRIRRWIDRHGWDEERGAYVMAKGSKALDASVLLHSVSGFDRGERMSRTIDALRAELGRGPLLYRYSGMEREEGTFVACAFWTVSALACVGRTDEAIALMDELLATVPNDVGVMSEMAEEASADFLGNLPQALSHLALVQAASVIRELT